MLPHHLVGNRVGIYFALEVDVVALLDVLGVEAGAERQSHHWHV